MRYAVCSLIANSSIITILRSISDEAQLRADQSAVSEEDLSCEVQGKQGRPPIRLPHSKDLRTDLRLRIWRYFCV